MAEQGNEPAIIPARIEIPVKADWTEFDRDLEQRSRKIDELGKRGEGDHSTDLGGSATIGQDMLRASVDRLIEQVQQLIQRLDSSGGGAWR